MTILPFLLLALYSFVMSDSNYPLFSCPLCKSKTLWNISMIVGRNVENRARWRVAYKNNNSGFLTFGAILHCFVWNRFLVCSVTGIPFRIFWWHLVKLQNRTRRRVPFKNYNSAFLTAAVISLLYLTLIMHWFSVRYVSRTLFGIFWWYLVVRKNRTRRHVTYKNDDFGFFLLLELSPLLELEFDFFSLLCNTNTLWNILMMLGTNVEQDETCCVQEWQLWRDWGTFVSFFF